MLNTLQPHPVALFLMLLLSATKALPSAFENPISTPAWTVGAFLALYAILPYCLPLLKVRSHNPPHLQLDLGRRCLYT